MNNSIDKIRVQLVFSPEKTYPVGEVVKQNRNLFFKYHPQFIKSGVQLSPFKLPLSNASISIKSLNIICLLAFFWLVACSKPEPTSIKSTTTNVVSTTYTLGKKDHFEDFLPFIFYRGYADIGSYLELNKDGMYREGGGSSLWYATIKGSYELRMDTVILHCDSVEIRDSWQPPHHQVKKETCTDTLFLWEFKHGVYLAESSQQDSNAVFDYADVWRDHHDRYDKILLPRSVVGTKSLAQEYGSPFLDRILLYELPE